MFLLATVIALAACSQEVDMSGIRPKSEIKVNATTSDTRISFGDKGADNMRPIYWSADDCLYVVETASIGSTNKVTALTATGPTLSNGGRDASFSFSFDAATADRYSYMACYGEYVGSGEDYICAEVPSVQMPTANSVDPKACVLFAKDLTLYSARPSELSLTLTHATAYGCMTLKNVGRGIKSVTLTADTAIATTSYGCLCDEIGDMVFVVDGTESNSITFDGIEDIAGDGSQSFDVWFGSIPAEISRFKVAYTTTDGRTFCREIDTAAAGKKPLTLARGKVHAFSVDMASAVEQVPCYEKVTDEPADWSGKYLIVYENGTEALVYTGIDKYSSSTLSVAVADNRIESNATVDACATVIEPYGNGYSIEIGDKGYIGHSGTSAGIKFSTSMDSDLTNTLSYSTSGVSIKSVGTGYSLRYNNTNTSVFRFYKSGQKAIQLYKYTGSAVSGGTTPPATEVVPTFDSVETDRVTESTALVYCVGENFDLAASVCFVLKADGGATLRVTPDMCYATYASAELSGLSAGTKYTVYAEAVMGSGTTVTSSSATFTTKEPSTSHRGWLELPAMTPSITTATEHCYSSGDRNYTAYYDTATYSSLWVAYPLAKGHTGSLSRPDWEAAPDIAESSQINVWDGSYGVNYASGNIYARGHQVPNADRNGNAGMQAQTFYAINSTPQIQNGFNGGIWANLETAIRNALPSSGSDSLYVATGPVYKTVGGSETVKYIQPQHDSKKCPVPNYYFKVVLKVKRTGSAVTSAMAVGFWFEHKVYSDSYTSYACTVDEIEQKTGFDFFANLPDDVESVAEKNGSWDTFTSW